MSLYHPKQADLYTARLADGWHVMDKFGPLDGPYASSFDARSVILKYDGTGLARHQSYADCGL